jgi:hypothetical protein
MRESNHDHIMHCLYLSATQVLEYCSFLSVISAVPVKYVLILQRTVRIHTTVVEYYEYILHVDTPFCSSVPCAAASTSRPLDGALTATIRKKVLDNYN